MCDDSIAKIQTEFVLSPEDWDKFNAVLENPPEPTPALRELLRGSKKGEIEHSE